MIGDILIGEPKQTAGMIIKIIEHYETYNDDIDIDYDAKDKKYT